MNTNPDTTSYVLEASVVALWRDLARRAAQHDDQAAAWQLVGAVHTELNAPATADNERGDR